MLEAIIMDVKRRVLIADDESVNREFFDIMLGNLGFIVDKAENGEEALSIIKSRKPDIIIIDDMLNGMTGWQVVKLLKKDIKYSDYSDIPVIMLSDMADPETLVEGFDLGVDDYIRKPFSFAVVFSRIKAALRNRDLMYKRLKHDETIELIDSLNQTFKFLTEHLKVPVESLQNAAKEFSREECMDKDTFVKLITENTDKIKAAIDSLSDKIVEIKKNEDSLVDMPFELSDLDSKYKNHIEKTKGKGV